MGRLQYISSTNGAFSITSSTWLNQIGSDCVIEYKFLSKSRTTVLDFGAVDGGVSLSNGMRLTSTFMGNYLQWYNGTRTTISTSKWTLNEPHILTLSGSEYKWDGETIASVSNIQTVNNPTFKPTINGNFYYFKVKKNGTDFINLVPWETNGVLYIKDLVSNNELPIRGSWTAGPADDSNVVPINKYKLYTSNIQKTYNGSTQINKMYVGSDLVYRALSTTIVPTITYAESITQDTDTCTGWLDSSSIDTGVPHTTSTTTVRIIYQPKCGRNPQDVWNFSNRIVGYINHNVSNSDFRIFGYNSGTFDYNGYRNTSINIIDTNTVYDLTLGDCYVYDNQNNTYLCQTTTKGSVPTLNEHIFVDVQFTNVMRVIIQDGNTVLFDGKAAYDNLGHIGLYDEVSQSMKYNSNLQMRYETL